MARRPNPGQPPIFETIEDLQAAIDDYFATCQEGMIVKRYDAQAKMFVEGPIEIPRTTEGLAFHLGMTRQSLLNYQNRDDKYFDAITRAKERINVWKTQMAWIGDVNPRVWEFDMKNNANYKDQTESVVTNKTGTVKPEIPDDIE